MTAKRQTTQKPSPSRHSPAFHVKDGPINVLDAIKRLRQIRHGLENSPDQTEPLNEARDHVDTAITELSRHVFIDSNHHEAAIDTTKHRDLEAAT